MRLFHFSHAAGIERFEPRPLASRRAPGREWLNGPLVWAIEEARQAMYLFPRDCPRILLWPTPQTTPTDRERWFGASDARILAHVEWTWLDRLRTGDIWRYEMPVESFEDVADAGMWVSRRPIAPTAVKRITDLPAALRAQGVELRVLERLTPLRDVWSTSLHASGIRLENAVGWAR